MSLQVLTYTGREVLVFRLSRHGNNTALTAIVSGMPHFIQTHTHVHTYTHTKKTKNKSIHMYTLEYFIILFAM